MVSSNPTPIYTSLTDVTLARLAGALENGQEAAA